MKIEEKNFRKIIQDYYLPSKVNEVRANTFQGYEKDCRLHLIPKWGDRDIDTITFDEVQEWVNQKPDTRGQVQSGYRTLRQIFRWYQNQTRYFFDDPTQGIKLPKLNSYTPKVFTQKDMEVFLNGIKGHPVEAVAIVQLRCGLRRSEGFGVRWSDIDFKEGSIYIHTSRQVIGSEIVEYPTKNKKSTRYVYLPKKAIKRLKEIRRDHPNDEFLYEGRPDFGAGSLRKFAMSRSLPWVPMMNFRHTFATHAIENGVEISDLANILGHTKPDMTYSHYIQMTPRMHKNALKKMNQSPLKRFLLMLADKL